MKKLPWKKIAAVSLVIVALVVARVAVSIGRASYWGTDWLPAVRNDPWVYVGFAAAALAIIAWMMFPSQKKAEPAEPQAETEDTEIA